MNTDEPRVRQFIRGLPDGPVPFHYPAPIIGKICSWSATSAR